MRIMSQSQRRTRNVHLSKSQPTILRSRKRKMSENDVTVEIQPKIAKRDKVNTRASIDTASLSPLVDVTSAKLNIDVNRSITPEAIPDTWSQFRSYTTTCFPSPLPKRNTPLPNLIWADRHHLWAMMCRKDKAYRKNPDYLQNHSNLEPKMRSILLDWLTEVCEVYKLHRETYYLAVDYIDRYLSKSTDVPRHQLQLIGITCLFIAAKIEEIYPPKLSEFSYVTDSACMDNEILDKELVILKVLNWDLSPVTTNSWLNTYLQLVKVKAVEEELAQDLEKTEDPFSSFEYVQYSGLMFVQIAKLLDLCTLDIESLQFSPRMLAATALYFYEPSHVIQRVTGYATEELKDCRNYMAAFYITIKSLGPTTLKHFENIPQDDLHNIQTHSVDLDALTKAHQHLSMAESQRKSPPISQMSPDILTPPKSDEKTYSSKS